ncbi:LysE family translocator [Streptomyces sp. CMB-StM0423]|uniref:LysE family translocator n=1 Tax=Streptomyces sp. CMB-StM0423 TaxID=2059884 RepID=UPI000C704468|nr:LysE family translocator [Streptomyces sp. CMB-StM0423]AUH39849.1 LysE family translocator [Streptomyces sp. CMB-StM0423]
MADFASYLGLCLLITLTPGLDTAVVIRSAVNGGRGAGLQTALGCAAGLFVHAVAVAFGLAGLLLRSAVAFEIVKFCGAALLCYLGARSLWAAWRARREDPAPAPAAGQEEAGGPAGRGRGTPFVQGLLTNLTNPKATLFFMASLPQFMPDDRPGTAVPVALALAAVAVLFSMSGLGLTALAVGRVRHLLRSRRARRIQETLLGGTLVALGVRVATE